MLKAKVELLVYLEPKSHSLHITSASAVWEKGLRTDLPSGSATEVSDMMFEKIQVVSDNALRRICATLIQIVKKEKVDHE